MSDYFWNLTDGVRPVEPVPGLFAQICGDMGHVYDDHYGPLTCARCGHRNEPVKVPRKKRFKWLSLSH